MAHDDEWRDACPARLQGQGQMSVGQTYVSVRQSLKKFATRICANTADGEDIAQEALVRAMSAEADTVIENPKAYLYRVAHNLAVRKRSSSAREIIGHVEDLGLGEIPCEAPSVEDQIITRERLGLLSDAIATLPPACRQVFVMRKVYGHSHKEIARKLGISTSTVEKHLATGFSRCVAFMRSKEMQDAARPDAESASDGVRLEAAGQRGGRTAR